MESESLDGVLGGRERGFMNPTAIHYPPPRVSLSAMSPGGYNPSPCPSPVNFREQVISPSISRCAQRSLVEIGLERERHATTYRARGLHQVNCASVSPQDWDISLRQKVAQINDGLEVAGEESGSGQGLAEKEA